VVNFPAILNEENLAPAQATDEMKERYQDVDWKGGFVNTSVHPVGSSARKAGRGSNHHSSTTASSAAAHCKILADSESQKLGIPIRLVT
jgi:hypothetical protein